MLAPRLLKEVAGFEVLLRGVGEDAAVELVGRLLAGPVALAELRPFLSSGGLRRRAACFHFGAGVLRLTLEMLVQLARELHSERVRGVEREHGRERVRSLLHRLALESASRLGHRLIDAPERLAGLGLSPERVSVRGVAFQQLFRLRQRRPVVLLGQAALHQLQLAREERLTQGLDLLSRAGPPGQEVDAGPHRENQNPGEGVEQDGCRLRRCGGSGDGARDLSLAKRPSARRCGGMGSGATGAAFFVRRRGRGDRARFGGRRHDGHLFAAGERRLGVPAPHDLAAEDAQMIPEGGRVGEAALGFLVERPVHHAHQGSGKMGVLGERLPVALNDLEHRRVNRVGAEGLFPGQELVEHRAEREDVGAGVDSQPLDLFRRHVVRGAHHLAGLGHVRRSLVNQTEVENLHLSVLADMDVRWLQVAMDDSPGVREAEAVRDLLHDAEDLIHGDGRAALDELLQVLALEQLHHHVEVPLLFDEVIDGDDIGVVEPGGVSRLALEALHEIGVGAESLGDDLDRDVTVQDGIVAFVDLTHGPFANLPDDVVFP